MLSNDSRSKIIMASCFLAVALGIATPKLLYPQDSITTSAADKSTVSESPAPATGSLQKGTPKFDTVLPKDSTIEELGGWTRVSPSNRDPVFAYIDNIGSVPINISQQPLPKDFKDDPDDQVRDLANGFGATRVLKVDNYDIYLGTSAKGPQSVIFRRESLLILIKASAEISDDEWRKYIQSLS